METPHTRDFSHPDDTIRMEGLVSHRVALGAHHVSHAIHAPGWRWSTHAGALGAGRWCPTHHVGYALSGSLHVALDDGTEFDVVGGEVFEIPSGHDAWVTGDAPFVTIDWVGVRSWLAERKGAPTILATILFTDVVDSSGEALRRGDTHWNSLNTTLADRTRDVVLEFGGSVIKSMGDGVLAVFDGAARAVRCGIELTATASHLGLAIRVGIHTGEVEPLAGDVHGLSVHEAARVVAVAGSGQVLVSDVTRTVAAAPDLRFEEHGTLELKGIGHRRLFLATRTG